MPHVVKIESFEGPFQLLLALVSEQKVDIGAVSVSEVADQYLAYLETMRDFDMDVASDFLVVASTLLTIKASALLPDENELDYDDDFEDLTPSEAREILITRLIAYKQFKNVAASLSRRFETENRMHARQASLESAFIELFPDYLEGITLHNLAIICAGLLARRKGVLIEAEHITAKPIPIDERLEFIYARLSENNRQTFKDLLDGEKDPVIVVASFLALLELYHRGMIDLEQPDHRGAIDVIYVEESKWAPAPMLQTPDDPVMEYLESQESTEEKQL